MRSGSSRGKMAPPIQIILTRRLDRDLSVPLILVDPFGTLLFYSEPAETLMGRRFRESGAMPADEWSSSGFVPVDDEGKAIPSEEFHAVDRANQTATGVSVLLHAGLDGVLRHLGVATIPGTRLQDKLLGAAAIFREAAK
jgi:hypothetical protein